MPVTTKVRARWLTAACVLMVLLGMGVTWLLLEQAAFDQYGEQLQSRARHEAQLLAAIYRHHRAALPDDPATADALTLAELIETIDHWTGFGESGELTLGGAGDRGGEIRFVYTQRSDRGGIVIPAGSDWAAPMRHALRGDTGLLIGPDYRGDEVMAAYTPIADVGLGLVEKINTSEIRKPFIQALTLLVPAAVVLGVLVAAFCRRIWRPVISGVRQDRERYRTLFDRSVLPLCVLDCDGKVMECNPQAQAILGSDTAGHTLDDWLEADFSDWRTPGFTRLVNLRNARLAQKFELRIESISDRNDHFLAILSDVTRMHREHTFARSVIDSLSAHIAVLDETGRIVLVNRAWEEFAGSQGGVGSRTGAGVNYLDVVRTAAESDPSARQALEGLESLGGEESSFTMIYPCHSPTEQRWFAMHATRLIDRPGLVVAHEDITIRRQAELEAARASNLLRRAQSVARVGGWDLDADTLDVHWTEETYRIQDIDPEDPEYDLRAAIELYEPGGREEMEKAVERCLSDGTPFDLELPLITAKGRHIYVRAAGEAEFENGRVVRLSGAFGDVTEKVQAEQLLKAERATLAGMVDAKTEELQQTNAELQRAVKIKDQFLANMSHELRTPLNGVLILAESLDEEVYGELTERQKRCVTGIRNSGSHLLTLINDVLDLSRIEADVVSLTPATVPVVALVESSFALVRDQARRKGLELVVDIAPDTPSVYADELRLKQVLVNLLSNAVKFSEHGSIRVEVRTVEGWHELAVVDNGPGIAPEDVAKLFTPFTQLDATLSRHHEGTGLGLVIVRRLVELHGGTVHVESEPGHGARFVVRLPVAAADSISTEPDEGPDDDPAAPWTSTSSTVGTRALRILLADDNAVNRDALTQYITVLRK